jgi:hypothetical protein
MRENRRLDGLETSGTDIVQLRIARETSRAPIDSNFVSSLLSQTPSVPEAAPCQTAACLAFVRFLQSRSPTTEFASSMACAVGEHS